MNKAHLAAVFGIITAPRIGASIRIPANMAIKNSLGWLKHGNVSIAPGQASLILSIRDNIHSTFV